MLMSSSRLINITRKIWSKYWERLFNLIQPYLSFFQGAVNICLSRCSQLQEDLFIKAQNLMYLDKIPETEYKSLFSKSCHREVLELMIEALSRIFYWTRGHTFYVQHVVIFYLNQTIKWLISIRLIRFFIGLTSQEPLFTSYRNLIPAQQFKLLQASPSKRDSTTNIRDLFIKDHKLTSPAQLNLN